MKLVPPSLPRSSYVPSSFWFCSYSYGVKSKACFKTPFYWYVTGWNWKDRSVRFHLRTVLQTDLTGYSVFVNIFLLAGDIFIISVIIFQNSVGSYNDNYWYIYSWHRRSFTISTILLATNNISTETLLVLCPSHSFCIALYMVYSDIILIIQYKDNYLQYMPYLFWSISRPILLVQDFNISKHVFRAFEWSILRRKTFPPLVLVYDRIQARLHVRDEH